MGQLPKLISLNGWVFRIIFILNIFNNIIFAQPHDEHLKQVEEWNFSSANTIDDRSLIEDQRQKAAIDKMFKLKKKPKGQRMDELDHDDAGPTDCFNTVVLQFFVKVFD